MRPETTRVESAGHSILARNSMILVGTEILAKCMGLLVFIPLARTVGAAELGTLAFAVSISQLVVHLPRFGFERFVQRQLSRSPETFSRLWATIMAIKAPFSGIAAGGVLTILWLNRTPISKMWIVLLVLTSMLLYDSLAQFHSACFRAFHRAEYEAVVRLLYSAIYVVGGLAAIRSGWGVTGVASALVVAGAVAVAHSTWLLHRRICSLTLSVDRAAITPVLTESLPFFLMILVVLIYNQIDMILLSFMSGDHETGIYAAAMKPFEATSLIPAGVMGTLLPALSRDWPVSKEQFAKTFTASFRYMGMLGLPLAVGGVVCAVPLVQFLYGGKYEESARAFQILIVAVVFSFWNHLFSAALVAMNREKDLLKIGIGGVVVSIALNLSLIPRYGALGSGMAVVVTQLCLFLLAFIPIFREIKNSLNVVVTLFRPVLCTGAMAVVLWLIYGSPLPVLILVGIAVYLGALMASGTVRPKQLRLLLGRHQQG